MAFSKKPSKPHPKAPRGGKSNNAFSGNHQRSWLWGKHAVLEAVQSGRWPVLSLFVTQEAFDESAQLLEQCSARGLQVEVVTSDRLFELCKSTEHQGLIARMGQYPYGSMQSLADRLQQAMLEQTGPEQAGPEKASPEQADAPNRSCHVPLVVLCDRIQDTFNFGAILRCCDGAGVAAVIVGEQGQAEVTPHVARSSVGAVHHVEVVRAANLVAAVKQLKALGFKIIAADSNTTESLWSAPLNQATALVIGSEAHGVSQDLLAACDLRLRIPMLGQVTSLNAAVAAGIMLYEIRRQQNG